MLSISFFVKCILFLGIGKFSTIENNQFEILADDRS